MAEIDPSTIAREPRTFFLEGVKTKYQSISVTGYRGGYLTINVTVPFAKSLRAVRAKTVGQVFFGNKLFLLAEGELVQKAYKVGPQGPLATLTFNGVAGNLAFLKYAATASGSGTAEPVSGGNMANEAQFTVVSGAAVGAVTDAVDSPNPGAYLASTINRSVTAAAFQNALNKTPYDIPFAFREIAKNILYADVTNPTKSGIYARGAATTQLSSIDARFKLIESMIGYTNQELIKLFYGTKAGSDGINPFLGTILEENMTGEHSVMEVFRLLSERAFHVITEMVAPPFFAGEKPALGRMMIVPQLFSADPPVCNVFLRRMCTDVTFSVTALKTTRLIMSQNFPYNESGLAIMSIAPDELAESITGGQSKRVKLFASTTQEESEVGVLAQGIPNVYGSAYNLEENPDDLVKWFAKSNSLRFLDVRTEGQTATVAMEFNPFVAIGFPGLFFDPFIGVGRGFVKNVTHTITPSSASTTVEMTHCVFADAMEYTTPSADIETGFNGVLPSYANTTVSEVYEAVLGCKSLTAAAPDLLASSPSHDLPAIGGDIAFVAESVNRRLSEGVNSASDKTEMYRFIMRSVASYEDLMSFYQPGVEPPPDGIPNALDMGMLYVSKDGFLLADAAGHLEPHDTLISIDPLDSTAPKIEAPYIVPVPSGDSAPLPINGSNGDGVDKYQIVDRVQAVLDYVKEIG